MTVANFKENSSSSTKKKSATSGGIVLIVAQKRVRLKRFLDGAIMIY